MANVKLYNNSCADVDLSSDVIHSYTYLIVNDCEPSETQQPQGNVIYDRRLIGKNAQAVKVYTQSYQFGTFTQTGTSESPTATVTMKPDTVEWSEGTADLPTYVIVEWKYA